MKKYLLRWVAPIAAAAAALAFSSCAYDPYYGGGYSSYDYGYGYGYGGSSFSTSFFIGTGDPRWGYDPYVHCYYDYYSHRYYDPYLYGFYPIGYRPPILIGVPHPHGWHQGHGHLPPPRHIRNRVVPNYHNRASAYRSTNYSWANDVRIRSASGGAGRNYNRRSEPNRSSSQRTQGDRPSGVTPYGTSGSRYNQSRYDQNRSRGNTTSYNRTRNYSPQSVVSTRQRDLGNSNRGTSSNYRSSRGSNSSRQYSAPQPSRSSRQSQPSFQNNRRGNENRSYQRSRDSNDNNDSDNNRKHGRSYRSLGQG